MNSKIQINTEVENYYNFMIGFLSGIGLDPEKIEILGNRYFCFQDKIQSHLSLLKEKSTSETVDHYKNCLLNS